MSSQSLSYVERAEHCEQMALRVKDPEARLRFVELARQWRALAKQADELGPVGLKTYA
jgi:hypothetical protein